jgi:NTE family protein
LKSQESTPDIAQPLEELTQWLAGQPLDPPKLHLELLELDGAGRFSALNYSMVEHNGKQGLQVEALEKPYSPPIVRLLIVIDGSDYNDAKGTIAEALSGLRYGDLFGSIARANGSPNR